MMKGNECMHVDAEYCEKCFPKVTAAMTLSEMIIRIEKLEQLERQHVISWGRLTDDVKKLETTLSDLITKIAEIGNYCYREK